MEKHEIKVKHKSTGKLMVIAIGLYHSSPDTYEVIEGEPGESPKPDSFKPPVPNKPVITKDKQGEEPKQNKAPPKAPKKSVEPPKV
jgi:hypothetical protein